MDHKKHEGDGGCDNLLEIEKSVPVPAEETKEKGGSDPDREISNLPTEILQHLFEFLLFDDLAKCRLVNSEWCKAVAVPARKKLKQLKFADRDVFATHGVADLQKFIDCVNSTDSFGVEYFPVGRYHLHLDSTIRSVFPGKPVLDTFFKTISGIAREISLEFSLGWNYLSDQDLPRIHNYPQLKCVKLTILSDECSKDSGPQYRKIFQFIRTILEKKNAPSLEKISVGFGSGIFELETIPMCINQIGSLKMITRIELQTLFNKVDWTALSSLGLELKILRIPFGACKVDAEMFKRFLESQSGTLESLEIFYQAQWTSVSIELPRLENLERFFLHVRSRFIDGLDGVILFPNMFQRGDQFPSLKKLTLEGQVTPATFSCFLKNENGIGIEPMVTMEELSLSNSFRDGGDMQKFAKIFPSIKKLRVGAHVKVLRRVYEEMQDLEELTLETSTENIDAAVTGLSRQMCGLIGRLEMLEEVFYNGADSSMTSLQKVKVLRLENQSWRWSRELEFQVSPVIWKTMKSLRCLDLGLRKFPFREEDVQLLEDLRESICVMHRSPPIARRANGNTSRAETDSDSDTSNSNFSATSTSEESEFEYFSEILTVTTLPVQTKTTLGRILTMMMTNKYC